MPQLVSCSSWILSDTFDWSRHFCPDLCYRNGKILSQRCCNRCSFPWLRSSFESIVVSLISWIAQTAVDILNIHLLTAVTWSHMNCRRKRLWCGTKGSSLYPFRLSPTPLTILGWSLPELPITWVITKHWFSNPTILPSIKICYSPLHQGFDLER